jgi:hypothetical protein
MRASIIGRILRWRREERRERRSRCKLTASLDTRKKNFVRETSWLCINSEYS